MKQDITQTPIGYNLVFLSSESTFWWNSCSICGYFFCRVKPSVSWACRCKHQHFFRYHV